MWFDRLSQNKLTTLPMDVEPGRYQWLGNRDESLNGRFDIHDRNLLLNDGTARCQLISGSHSFFLPNKELKSDITLFNNAIRTICKQLENDTDDLISPMLPVSVISSESDLLPVEKMLLQVLDEGHLHQISQRPRLDIKYNEEVTDASRAKRLAKGALVHLASHSECWQRQTLSGVVPKKVLAQFSDDEFNIYENCIYARLLDKFELHLQGRLFTLRTLLSTLDQAMEFYQSDNIDFRLSQKVCELWGMTFDEDSTGKTSELLSSTLDTLQHLLKKIRNLKLSGLYLLVNRAKQISGTLYRTNILSHDPHYRHLAFLWENLEKTVLRSKMSPDEQFKDNQFLSDAYSRYTGLVLKHALFPYMGGQDECSWAGRTLRLQRDGLEWQLLSLSSDGSYPGEILLTIIPWISYLSLSEEQIPLSKDQYIAWPSIGESFHQCAYQKNFINLSPSDMYCVERFGLLIDQTLYQKVLSSFSKPITKIPTKILALAEKMDHISVDHQQCRLEIHGEIHKENKEKLRKALIGNNARKQASDLEFRYQEILFLGKCPVCSSTNEIIFQKPGFKEKCDTCGLERYLRKTNGAFHFEQKYLSRSGINDFLNIGRRGFSLRI
ncbi:hypothetical protein [Vibrio sp. RM-69-4]|uniref:hypothetical protein n=1 Tax=Vibrio sp. RM-69-4 TaxID=2950157 RepID=UPI00215B9EA9|nr:hypothetical protein [Vibrio sp. RM-69-4]MCR9423742.1 hypothetical protein [Vibrio sp. RM-69-4]